MTIPPRNFTDFELSAATRLHGISRQSLLDAAEALELQALAGVEHVEPKLVENSFGRAGAREQGLAGAVERVMRSGGGDA